MRGGTGGPRPRPDLADLQPYRTSDAGGGRVFLHANENPYPPPPDIVEEIFALAREHPLNRYPGPSGELTAEIAAYAGVDPSWVLIGDGSNEVLLQSCLAFGGPGRTAMVMEPTYRMHHRQARMAGTDVVQVRREPDFTVDPVVVCEAISAERPDIVFVCSPNNPTGTLTPPDDLTAIASASPGLVVVDEAYFEFCGVTLVPQLARLPNVMVVRTLSKAFRLASVRLGYGIARPEVLEELRRVRMPYGQSAFTQAAALVALRRRDDLLEVVGELAAERDRVAGALAGLGGTEVFASGANFVLFRHPGAEALLDALARRGIVIRDFRHLPGCEGCLRVSVGTPAENDEFLEVARSVG